MCACVWLVGVYVRPLAHARALPESVRKFQRVLCNIQYSILAVGKTLSKMMLVYCTLERAFIFVCSRRMCVSTHVSIVLCVAAKLYTQLSCSLLRARRGHRVYNVMRARALQMYLLYEHRVRRYSHVEIGALCISVCVCLNSARGSWNKLSFRALFNTNRRRR